MMVIFHGIGQTAPPQTTWEERWEGADKGLVCAWLAGIDKARQDSALALLAQNGELPVLPFKGGLMRKIKAKSKIGSLHYVAMWQGLRGEDLHIDLDADFLHTCTKTGVPVTFTRDTARLMTPEALDNGE